MIVKGTVVLVLHNGLKAKLNIHRTKMMLKKVVAGHAISAVGHSITRTENN